MIRRQQDGTKRPRKQDTSMVQDEPLPGRVPQTELEPVQPSSTEQSGSTGRPAGGEDDGKNTGQGHYGQNGADAKPGEETDGQARYRRSGS
jgi:hypothetical protein